jgi:hypothetical protein
MDIPKIEKIKWGPGTWNFIHFVAITYPKEPTDNDMDKYLMFFTSLQHVLPCPKCSDNYKRHLDDFPIQKALTNNQELFKWTVDIHNEVNKELNKREYSYEEALNIYLNPTQEKHDTYTLIGVLLLLFFVFLLADRKWKIISRFI